MSDKRVIKVNPDLFKITNSTKKKRQKESKDIKIKTKRANNQTMKRKLLNLIRSKQDEKIKTNNLISKQNDHSNEFKSDFNESLEYLENVTRNPKTNSNSTIKNRNFESNNNYTNELKGKDVTNELTFNNSNNYKLKVQEFPKYGCLKNGTLPTYREFIKNTTHKNYNSINEENKCNTNTNINTDTNTNTNNISLENAKIVNEFKQNQNLLKKEKPPQKLRKKTVRRNFTIGRSKKIPKISVLISNKTIRKNISTKKTLLQQTPLSEVKRFLIKRGLIKIGSIAPNDVLRKMYESASMLCGEVKNHNKENLLYNFFNYNED